MAAWLGSYGTESFGEDAYPRPAAVFVNYTGLSEVYGNEPPTYSAVGTSDGIASYRTMERRINAIQANGTDAEIEVFHGLSHGFGLGTGTVMKKQTAGRDRLGDLAPKFAELNDDVLFGEVWSREKELSPRDRSMITIAALFSAGLYPQLKSHLSLGKEHGVTKAEAIEIVTQLAFYCGWPKAWSTFPMIQEIYGDE